MTAGYQPGWDFDLANSYGKPGEDLARTYLELWIDCNTKVEVKRKTRTDPWFYIETEHDPGRTGTYQPSGLMTTESDIWCFIISDIRFALFLPRRTLERAIELGWGKPTAENDGSCPTHGTLISFNELVEIDMAFSRVEDAPRCRICGRPMLAIQDKFNGGAHYSCLSNEDA